MASFSSGNFSGDGFDACIVYMYTYKYNIYKNAFSFKLLEEAVIFKSLKYTVPSLARSLARSFVHTRNLLVS